MGFDPDARRNKARKRRALIFLAHLSQYKKYGPLIGPKEVHQPDFRWVATKEN